MARQAAARLKQVFSVVLVTLRLRRDFAVKTVLPEISGDCFQVILAVLVHGETPKCRHLGPGTKGLWIFQPDGNPFLAQFEPDILQIGSNFFLVLQQIASLQIQLVDARGQLAVCDAQRFSMNLYSLHFGFVADLGIFFLFRLPLVRVDLVLQLGNLLTRVRQRVSLAVESLHAMAAHTAALIEKIFPEVKGLSAFSDPIVGVARLASGFSILLMKKGMQPERIQAVRFLDAGGGAAIAAMTG